ncbi:MAG TPA: prolipoprotein diacylglyceryl transferase [Candidatus Moranbacteria bacterium]|nr:prolipoprotein diacylglyceryl transferase [Candidatus Moranbacteria bacterium]
MSLAYYQEIPLRINPTAFEIGGFPVSWYALGYVVGFLTVGVLVRVRMREEKILTKRGEFWEELLFLALAALLGGRMGYALFYALPDFWREPGQLISPFDESGAYVGIRGMSYFGALSGVILVAFWRFRHDLPRLGLLARLVVPGLGAGYFWGRLGNFLGGELYGKVTFQKWGMRFADNPAFLRHPSQLYEAFTEGILPLVILWPLRKISKFPFISAYVALYCAARFFCEFFRAEKAWFLFLTQGQFFSLAFCLLALAAFPLERKKCYNPKESGR